MTVGSRREFIGNCLSGLGAAGCSAWIVGCDRAEPAAPEPAGSARDHFLDAVRSGDVAAVTALLGRDHALLSTRDRDGRTAFALAYLSRHPKIGELLREKGYQPDLHEAALALDWGRLETLAKDAPGLINQDHPIGGSAMYAAAFGGAGNKIWRVYQYGGEPDPQERSTGRPALMAALEHPDLLTAESTAAMLLGNGAAPNPTHAGVLSPLHVAAARGSDMIVEMLIRKGADLNATDQDGRTALDVAERNRHDEIATLLRNNAALPRDHSTSRLAYDVNGNPFKPGSLDTFSVIARNDIVGAAHFNFELVKYTVEEHPDLAKAIATTTEVSVEACAHTGRLPIVEYLLEHGAPYSLPTAVMRNDVKRAKELLAEDPKRINERGPHDFALLWYPVIGGGLLELAELLLLAGANVEHQHHLGTTALHWAVRGGQRDMAALLIDNGADVNRVGRKFDQQGETPLQTAAKSGRNEIADLLKAKGAKS